MGTEEHIFQTHLVVPSLRRSPYKFPQMGVSTGLPNDRTSGFLQGEHSKEEQERAPKMGATVICTLVSEVTSITLAIFYTLEASQEVWHNQRHDITQGCENQKVTGVHLTRLSTTILKKKINK